MALCSLKHFEWLNLPKRWPNHISSHSVLTTKMRVMFSKTLKRIPGDKENFRSYLWWDSCFMFFVNFNFCISSWFVPHDVQEHHGAVGGKRGHKQDPWLVGSKSGGNTQTDPKEVFAFQVCCLLSQQACSCALLQNIQSTLWQPRACASNDLQWTSSKHLVSATFNQHSVFIWRMN